MPHYSKYPNVECADHPSAPGYVVCKHVALHGARIALYERATPTDLGTVLCHACDLLGDDAMADLNVACASCIAKLLIVDNLHHGNDTGE